MFKNKKTKFILSFRDFFKTLSHDKNHTFSKNWILNIFIFRQNPSRPSSRAPSRCSSRDGLDGGRGRGLESPSLLRRMMSGPMDSDTPPSSPLPPRLQSVSPAPSSRDGETNSWTNGVYQSTKFVQPQTFQSVHNTENIYSKIGAGRTQSLDRSGLQERRTPERTVLPVRNLTMESRNRTPERIIPIQSVDGRMRTQSLGRGDGLVDEIGNRETIEIQTRDRSGHDIHGQGELSNQKNNLYNRMCAWAWLGRIRGGGEVKQ